jgi:hypothetical protein
MSPHIEIGDCSGLILLLPHAGGGIIAGVGGGDLRHARAVEADDVDDGLLIIRRSGG